MGADGEKRGMQETSEYLMRKWITFGGRLFGSEHSADAGNQKNSLHRLFLAPGPPLFFACRRRLSFCSGKNYPAFLTTPACYVDPWSHVVRNLGRRTGSDARGLSRCVRHGAESVAGRANLTRLGNGPTMPAEAGA